MTNRSNRQFSGLVTVFHERALPERATPAGYAALIHAYGLKVPIPYSLAAIATRHITLERQGWRLFTPRHAPDATLEGHLTFAIKYEGLDLAILKRLFIATGPGPIEGCRRSADRQLRSAHLVPLRVATGHQTGTA